MKAAVLKTIGQPLTIEEIADPVPGAGEVLVRVLAAPVLAYTRDVFTGVRPLPLTLPLVPGVGAVAVVEKTGPDATRLVPGQLVLCDPAVRSRDDSISPDIMLQGWAARGEGAMKLHAYFHNGSFAQKMLVPLENVTGLGDDLEPISPVKLSWLGTMLIPYSGLLAGNIEPGQVVMVGGATGHFGSAGVGVALAMGVRRVVALGRDKAKLDTLVSHFGGRVSPVLLDRDETVNRTRIAQAAGGPIDCFLDLLPPALDTTPIRRGIMAIRQGGTAVLMGGVTGDVMLPYSYIMQNNLVIRGQYMYPSHAPSLLVGLVRAGLINFEAFSTRSFALEEVNQAVDYAHDHGGAFNLSVLTPYSRLLKD